MEISELLDGPDEPINYNFLSYLEGLAMASPLCGKFMRELPGVETQKQGYDLLDRIMETMSPYTEPSRQKDIIKQVQLLIDKDKS